LSGVITKVTFSSFSKILSEKDRLREIYRQILQLVLFVSSTLIAFGCFFAKPIITILLGEKWLTIIPLFQILSLSFILYPIHSLNVNILNLYGRSDLFLKLEILKKIVFTVLMIICLYFGLIGLAWGSVLFSVFSLVINTYYTRSFLNYPLKSQIIDLVPTFLVVLVSSFAVYNAMANFIFFYELHTLILAFILYILVIIFISHLARLSPYKQLIKILRQNLR
jgi:O-antigen/teichoic acid export membrane protein